MVHVHVSDKASAEAMGTVMVARNTHFPVWGYMYITGTVVEEFLFNHSITIFKSKINKELDVASMFKQYKYCSKLFDHIKSLLL